LLAFLERNLDSKTRSGFTVPSNPYLVRVCRSIQFSDIIKKHEMAENVERKKQDETVDQDDTNIYKCRD
jgi:hypothetical protein